METDLFDELKGAVPEAIAEAAPLFYFLREHSRTSSRGFHMPGTGGSHAVPAFSRLDITELNSTDDLNDPAAGGPVAAAERKLADFCGAAASIFVTGGSSAGIMASLLALCGAGTAAEVILPRTAHRAFLNAAQVLGLTIRFVCAEVECSAESGPLSHPRLEDYERALLAWPQAKVLVVTSPDYYGAVQDLQPLQDICRSRACSLLVDAAHGAAWCIDNKQPLAGTVTVMSAHKTWPALTPAAFIHVGNSVPEQEQAALCLSLRRALKIVDGSSPPLYLAAAADWSRAFAELAGAEAKLRQLRYLAELEQQLPQGLKRIKTADSLRLVLDTAALCSGFALADKLRTRNLEAEMADLCRLVFLPSLMNDETAYRRLLLALHEAAAELAAEQATLSAAARVEAETARRALDRAYTARLSGVLRFCREHGVNLAESISAGALQAALNRNLQLGAETENAAPEFETECVVPYPPGIAYFWPGEERDACSLRLLEAYFRETQGQGASESESDYAC